MRRRDVRLTTLFGLATALLYGGAQLACSNGDDTTGGAGADAASTTDATSGALEAGAARDAEADGSDADMCFPSGAPAVTTGYLFPPVGSGACSTTQLTAIFAACYAASATNTACANLRSALGYASCFACAEGPSTNNPQAPVSYTLLPDNSGIPLPNVGGCIAAFDPAEKDCAEANTAADTCENNQCAGCRYADNQAIPSDPYGAIDQCLTTASDAGPCAALQATETACDDALTAADSGAAACFSLYDADGTFAPAYYAYITLVCGPVALSDAGSTDGGDGGD